MSTFGVIVSTRGFFPGWLAKEGRSDILAKLDKMGHKAVILDEDVTQYGAVEIYEDAKKCALLFKENADCIRGVIVVLPNFGDEVGVVTAIDLAKLNVPVMVIACDDHLERMDISNRRDSFCGKLSVCNNLKQYGIPFTNTSQHTYAIDSEEATKDIEHFDSVCRVVSSFKQARIGAIGTRPGAFQTVRFSEKILQKHGITVIVEDIANIIAKANEINDSQVLHSKLKAIRAYGNVPSGIPEESVIKQAKLSLAVEGWVKETDCDAYAIQCWDVVQSQYGCATCLTMSMMGEQLGIPAACEMDVTGALTMLALRSATGNAPGYMDWNNNYENDRDKCVAIHCSSLPQSFIGQDVEISNLDILGASLGEEKCFGACKGNVRGGDMTFAKITTDDTTGKIRVYVGEGEFTDDPITTIGAPAICKVDDLQGLMKMICIEGFEHHVAMVRSHCADVMEEALGKYLGFEVIRHK